MAVLRARVGSLEIRETSQERWLSGLLAVGQAGASGWMGCRNFGRRKSDFLSILSQPLRFHLRPDPPGGGNYSRGEACLQKINKGGRFGGGSRRDRRTCTSDRPETYMAFSASYVRGTGSENGSASAANERTIAGTALRLFRPTGCHPHIVDIVRPPPRLERRRGGPARRCAGRSILPWPR